MLVGDGAAREEETDQHQTALAAGEVVFGDHASWAFDLHPAGDVEPQHGFDRVSARWARYVATEEVVMADARMLIECPCGAILERDSVGAVVDEARRHAREVHDMTLSEEQARAMARPT